jgi:uncharacterized repeat protein (TIGR01451 family)
MGTNGKRAMIGASALALTAAGVAAAVAAPRAGERIGNQAAATYSSGGQTYSVQSNVVETTVAEVYGVGLTADTSRAATPGGFVFYPHTVTNTANTPDGFTLATAPATGLALDNVLIYADANQDGQPDGAPITATTALQPGASFPFLVRGTVPAGASPGATGTFTITATSQADAGTTASNTDTVTVTSGAVISLLKEQTIAVDADNDGQPSQGDTVEVTLTYNNTGGATAQNVVFTDQLTAVNDQNEAVTLTYVPGSGVWSDGGTLTDGDDGADHDSGTAVIAYDFDTSAGVNEMTAAIDQIPQGRRGTITFRYVLMAAPEGGIENQGLVAIDGGAPTGSNVSVLTIDPAYGIGVSDAELSATGGPAVGAAGATYVSGGAASATDDGTAEDDVVVETTNKNPGDEIAFEVVLSNLSDVADTFVLSADNTAFGTGSTFPAGTTFRFAYADGQTAVVGNRVNLAPRGAANGGDVRKVRLIATLPTNAAGTSGPANYEAQIVASSENNAGATGTDRAGVRFAGQVVVSAVDLTMTVGGQTYGAGTGAANQSDGGAPFVTEGIVPGGTATFPLTIDYASGVDTAFALSAANVPQGWTVTFEGPNGNPITSTPTLSAADSFAYTAVVTAPANAPADADGLADAAFDFRIASALTGASDQVKAGADVYEVADLSIEAPTSVQVAPGGVGIIAHTVTNRGNSQVTDWSVDFGTDLFTDQGYTAALFVDSGAQPDGVFTAGTDLAATPANLPGLAPGQTATIFVRVQVPEGAPAGQVETGDVAVALAATINGAATDQVATNDTVQDQVRIVVGDLVLDKSQALDAACDGTADGAFGPGTFDVLPGQCIAYRIRAENTGNSPATAVVITDNTPAFTTYEVCSSTPCAAAVTGAGAVSATAPAAGQSGTVATSPGFTLTPGQTATLSFTVKVDG